MNLINFSDPLGFPLEADATLGFMQTDYQNGIKALAKAFGADMVVVSGLVETGNTVADGWILLGGDLVFFQGGTKQTNFVVSETWVSKNNQNGASVQRYNTKKAVFGTGGTQYAYANLVRLDTIAGMQSRLLELCLEPEVVLSGCLVTNVNTGNSTCNISSGLAKIAGKFVAAPSHVGQFPVYLKSDGTWTNTLPTADFIRFDPHTSQRLPQVVERASFQLGDIKMATVLSDRFEASGLGKWERKGWAICNGANGTFDLRGRFPVGYASSDPGGGIHDTAYTTVGAAGGEKAHVLTIDEMPQHNHTGNDGGFSESGQLGMVLRSVTGQAVTTDDVDATNSGNEPNITGIPQDIPFQGNDTAHENRPPFRVVVFIQRI